MLERCVAGAKRQLDMVRERGDQLQESLIESDINHMLERLAKLYGKRDCGRTE